LDIGLVIVSGSGQSGTLQSRLAGEANRYITHQRRLENGLVRRRSPTEAYRAGHSTGHVLNWTSLALEGYSIP